MRPQNKVPIYVKLMSILVAFYADIRAINWTFVYGGSASQVDTGLFGLLYPVIIAMIVFISVLYQKNKWRVSPILVVYIIYLCSFYYITNSYIGPPRTKITLVMGFALGAMIIPGLATVDVKCFLRALMFFPSFAIFRLNQVFAPVKDWELMMAMDTSYAFLVPIVGTIVYVFLYLPYDNKKVKVLMLILCLINAIFFWQLFLHGSRGPLLSIVLLFVFLLIVRLNKNGIGIGIVGRRFRLFFVFSIIFIFGYVFLFQTIVDILAGFNIDSYALSKILELNKEGDVSNGRNYLNVITINGIIEHPILGHGFDRYDANTHALYPHNFILQLLYDGGILYFFVIMTPVVMGMIHKFKTCTYDEFAMLTCLLFSSVPGALFSLNLYENSLLWLFFGYTISKSVFVNNNNYIGGSYGK